MATKYERAQMRWKIAALVCLVALLLCISAGSIGWAWAWAAALAFTSFCAWG